MHYLLTLQMRSKLTSVAMWGNAGQQAAEKIQTNTSEHPASLSPAYTAFVASFEGKVENTHYNARIQALGNQASCQTYTKEKY